jgi:prepilin-type N-terminal cleavage/methylation domain-containing protein
LSLKRGPRAAQGFTLAELAVVMMIVALLLGSMMYTLSVQLEQRAIEETRSRLEAARQLLLSFAIVNGRLPCPATAASLGAEAFTGANCTSPYGGFLPAKTIGYQVVDAGGYAIDSWQNRIRYAVSAAALTGCAGSSTLPHFTNSTNLKNNGITCQPNDLVVCKSATGVTATDCGAAPANALTNQTVVVAIVHSIGKNGSLPCGTCVDEAANTNGDRVFVSHTLAPAGAPNGEFDDQLIWITVGELYGRMISAGVLP